MLWGRQSRGTKIINCQNIPGENRDFRAFARIVWKPMCVLSKIHFASHRKQMTLFSLSFSREKMNNAKRVQMTTKQCRCHSISLFVVKRTIFKYLYVRAKTTTKRKKLRGKSVPIGWRFGMPRHTNQFYVFFLQMQTALRCGQNTFKQMRKWMGFKI